jgi:hypothetical protein
LMSETISPVANSAGMAIRMRLILDMLSSFV